MRVILSGESGFVGRNLIAYLHKYLNIEFLFLKRRGSQLPNIISWEDLQIPGDVTTILHLAGKAHDLKNVSHPDEYYKVNFELTKQLFDAFLKSDATKFIFMSTVKAVASHVDGCLTEEHVPSPDTHYGKSKLMAEKYIQSCILPKNKSCYILRPCLIHGPGNKGNLNLLYKFVSKGLPYPLAAFANKRSFLSVENLCFIIKEFIERDDIPEGIYNVADDEPLSTNEVVSILSEALDKYPLLIRLPKSLVKLFAKLGDKLNLLINSESLGKLTEDYVVSNRKVKQALKKELPLSAREGILRTAMSFKN